MRRTAACTEIQEHLLRAMELTKELYAAEKASFDGLPHTMQTSDLGWERQEVIDTLRSVSYYLEDSDNAIQFVKNCQ